MAAELRESALSWRPKGKRLHRLTVIILLEGSAESYKVVIRSTYLATKEVQVLLDWTGRKSRIRAARRDLDNLLCDANVRASARGTAPFCSFLRT